MRDCIIREDTAINCTETTVVPNRPTQNSHDDPTGAASHPAHSGEAQRVEDSGSPPDTTPPWYAEGLRFECSQCGDCCTGAPGAVWVSEEELAAIADELGKPVGEVRLLHTKLRGGRWSLRDYPNGDCVFLDPKSRRCGVYAARPMQCRTWPFWPSNLETRDSWDRTCDHCPGSGVGTLHSLEVIQRKADACDI